MLSFVLISCLGEEPAQPDSASYAGAPCGDGDGDGFFDAICGGLDCNDSDPAIFPGAAEQCDGIDSDCSEFNAGSVLHTSGFVDGTEFIERFNIDTGVVEPNQAPGDTYPIGGSEIFGLAWYPPLGVFLAGDINGTFFHIDQNGTFSNAGSVNTLRGYAVVGTPGLRRRAAGRQYLARNRPGQWQHLVDPLRQHRRQYPERLPCPDDRLRPTVPSTGYASWAAARVPW